MVMIIILSLATKSVIFIDLTCPNDDATVKINRIIDSISTDFFDAKKLSPIRMVASSFKTSSLGFVLIKFLNAPAAAS